MPVIFATQQATRAIHIVFIAVVDPVAAGLVESIRRPEGNITGVTGLVPQLQTVLQGLEERLLRRLTPLSQCGSGSVIGSQSWPAHQHLGPRLSPFTCSWYPMFSCSQMPCSYS